MVSMASLLLVAFFYLVPCMHSSNARLLSAISKPFPANPHHGSISLQVAEKNGGDEMVERTGSDAQPPATTTFLKAEFEEFLTHDDSKKINGGGVVVVKEGSDIVESSISHHVALLEGTHIKGSERPITSEYHEKEEVKNDDVTVTDYQPPHRKTPIHNK
ncbi:uncharacterized protein LOC112502700 [Cynara cardunculus var. scolymus]|uniref:Uncharacterized protein n=1 Tax=Cynara cardunculus var. scolymus TaxID=59895 RepID=A0A103YJ93_CYNCS|nr:uncharacterized protein LOC112502700 [Cynara cardunculus var. scolymus]KVI10088.1 hypothetical protein Ccrd_011527 [Cynara cardunculus var. scolymus]